MVDLGNLQGMDLDSVVQLLTNYRRRGERAQCTFGDVTLDSETVTMDSAYLAVVGMTRHAYYRGIEASQNETKAFEEQERRQKPETKEEREERYRRMVEATKRPGEEVEITEAVVVEGLKFLLDSQDLPHDKLVLGLLMLDCNFTFDDLRRQFSQEELDSNLYDSLAAGKLVAGAGVILNVRDTEYGRDKFEGIIKGFVNKYLHVVTGDDSYGSGDGQLTGGGRKM